MKITIQEVLYYYKLGAKKEWRTANFNNKFAGMNKLQYAAFAYGWNAKYYTEKDSRQYITASVMHIVNRNIKDN